MIKKITKSLLTLPPVDSINKLVVTKALEARGIIYIKGETMPILFGLDSFIEIDFISIKFI